MPRKILFRDGCWLTIQTLVTTCPRTPTIKRLDMLSRMHHTARWVEHDSFSVFSRESILTLLLMLKLRVTFCYSAGSGLMTFGFGQSDPQSFNTGGYELLYNPTANLDYVTNGGGLSLSASGRWFCVSVPMVMDPMTVLLLSVLL